MNVLCTGGTGYVGQWMKRQEYKFIPADWNVFYLSHKDYDSMEWLYNKWEYIVHLANVDPTPVLANAEVSQAKMLYCSSGAVYNDKLSGYGRNKQLWENKVIKSNVNCSIARIFTCCGAGLKGDNYAMLNFIQNAKDRQPITIQGSSSTVRSYIYGSDLGDWMWTILFKGYDKRAYDVGSSERVTMLQLAEEVNKNFIIKSPIVVENKIPPSSYIPKFAYLTQLELGVKITVPFEKAVSLSVKDFYAS